MQEPTYKEGKGMKKKKKRLDKREQSQAYIEQWRSFTEDL